MADLTPAPAASESTAAASRHPAAPRHAATPIAAGAGPAHAAIVALVARALGSLAPCGIVAVEIVAG